MRRMGTTGFTGTLLQLWLGVGLVLSMAGCAREDGSAQGAASIDPSAQPLAAAAPTTEPVPALQSFQQDSQDRDRFRRTLAGKFDVSQVIERQASPEGGILHVPNGRVAHAVVAVKNADGTVRGHCLSSSAEVEALMQRSGVEQ
jgi:hypothetical protein